MDELKFTEGLVKKVINDRHHFFDIEKSKDLEHITNIKQLISSVSKYMKDKGLSQDEVNGLAEELRQSAW